MRRAHREYAFVITYTKLPTAEALKIMSTLPVELRFAHYFGGLTQFQTVSSIVCLFRGYQMIHHNHAHEPSREEHTSYTTRFASPRRFRVFEPLVLRISLRRRSTVPFLRTILLFVRQASVYQSHT